jgi:small subunit ribosomal protein S21
VLRGESIESALRRFKKSVQKDGLVADMRRSEHFVGPSEKRRKKSVAARKRLAKG